ncbi:MAG: VOC family protein [Gammaproteobacteria bacterium]
MTRHERIHYIELPARDLEAAQAFYGKVFGWTFESYGPEYLAFHDGGMDGGFYKADLHARCDRGSALVILYSDDLEATLAKVENGGGTILQAIFSFPGGRRFHFADPNDNELAVWQEVAE